MNLRTSLLFSAVLLGVQPPPVHADEVPPPAASLPTSVASAPLVTRAAAHELGQSYVFLGLYDDSLTVRVEITTDDLERALHFGWPAGAEPSREQVAEVLDSIRSYVEPRLSLSTGEGPVVLQYRDFDIRFLEVSNFVMLEYVVENTRSLPDEIAASFTVLFDVDEDHRNFLIIEHNWKTGTFNSEEIALIFGPRAGEQRLDLSSSSLWRGFVAFIRLGIWHIWIGIDHILFLLALVLPSVLTRRDGRWVPVASFKRALINIVTIVTFFTIAHSVTLSLAALDLVRLPSKFVESVIAGSIAVAALANLMPGLKLREAAIAFVFGLFHGFGFAHVLSEIGVGREHLVLSLLGFNIGVEIGQIAIICLAFPLLFLLRDKKIYLGILKWGSVALIAVAMLWVFERTFEFNVPIMGTIRQVLGR